MNRRSIFANILLKMLNIPYTLLLKLVYGAHVPYNADIHFSCKFPHSFYGVFISGKAKIGRNCTILNHVTIGNGIPKSYEAPKIGSNVFIGANSIVYGDIVINANVKIGAGVVLNKSIGPSRTVVNAGCLVLE